MEEAHIRFEPAGGWKVVLCNGMIRSASTWSYNVALGLMRAAVGDRVFGGYNENIAQFLADAPEAATYRVLKCHMLDARGYELIRSGEAKVIFTCRNLTDAAVSFMKMFQFDFEHTYAALQGSLELYQFHRREGKALILSYSEITGEPLDAVTRIAEHLDIQASPSVLEEITSQTSVEQARARVEKLKAGLEDDSLIRRDRFVYDRETLLNIDHIRDGRAGYGRALLTEDQASRIDDLAAQFDFTLE